MSLDNTLSRAKVLPVTPRKTLARSRKRNEALSVIVPHILGALAAYGRAGRIPVRPRAPRAGGMFQGAASSIRLTAKRRPGKPPLRPSIRNGESGSRTDSFLLHRCALPQAKPPYAPR